MTRPRRRLSVLVAEDNPVNRKVTAQILERAGHQCRLVEDGDQALDALELGRFDIVLMDVNMPGRQRPGRGQDLSHGPSGRCRICPSWR